MSRYSLAALSGALVCAAIWWWPLAMVALVPLYALATAAPSQRDAFRYGAVAGIFLWGPICVLTLAQLVPGLGGEYYTWVIRALSLPAALTGGILVGVVALLWQRMSGRSPLVRTLGAAGVWVMFEALVQWISNGYWMAALGTSLTDAPGALILARLGGAPLISFVAVFFAGTFVEVYRVRNTPRGIAPFGVALGVVALTVAVLAALPERTQNTLTVSIIQSVPVQHFDLALGSWQGNEFYNPILRALLESAGSPDLIVYPSPLAEQAMSPEQDASVGSWLARFESTSTSVLLWGLMAQDDRTYTYNALWGAGQEQIYQKNVLYPLSDYSPWWAKFAGVEKSSEEVSSGTQTAPLSLGGLRLGNLICSELEQDGWARRQGASADLILADGFDAFFPSAFAGEYSIKIARYRAAELGVSVVRANVFGPSALIAAGGKVVADLPYGHRGVLRAELPIERVSTPYRAIGEWGTYALCALVLCVAYRHRRR
ncbi:MAG: hypothetical protein KGI70_01060 [Patescibacteria group bacterium]|nr:hypothetical protein [Patescibacteria group bacterium]